MGKASSTKKVARAASTGGGRTAKGRRPVGWYTSLIVIVLLGTVVLVFSRTERQEEVAAGQTKVAPFEQGSPRNPAGDHWHAAYSVYACNTFLPPLEDNGRDPEGIHTHGDGVIHIHPFTRRSAGRNATLEKFESSIGIEFSESTIKYAGKTYSEGDDECSGKEGEVRFFANGKEVLGDPSDYRFKDRDKLVIAFVAKGEDPPKDPPTAGELDNLSDLPNGGPVEGPNAPTTTTPPGDAPPTTAPAGTTDTTAPASPSTTEPPG